MTYRYIKKERALRALRVDLADVRRIFERLTGHLNEEADRQLSLLQRPSNQTEEEFRSRVEHSRRNAFRITVTISGVNGADLFDDRAEVFSSPNLPDSISYVFMTNTTAFEMEAGRKPPNRFSFTLDFGRPSLLEGAISNSTSNNSRLIIEGDRDAWVAAIEDAVMGVLDNRKTGRSILHRAYVYDAGLLLFGFPFGLYLCWRAAPVVSHLSNTSGGFLAAAAYLYIGLVGVWAYRLLFGYTKWAFPSVELADNRHSSSKHRFVWWTIISGLAVNFLGDLLHWLT